MGDDDFLQNHKQYFSLADMEFMLNHFQDHSASSLMGFPGHDNFGAAFPSGLMFVQDNIPAMDDQIRDRPKRKQLATDHVSSSTTTSSPQLSDNGISTRLIKRGAGGARAKKVKKEEEKEREVIHVRAKRGEATDSHSLAERVRRGKINERLRCLQDIVPGCYKTMGMAVMLDEIINYVQSLQNQVEFLSMRLTAASTFHDFNSDTDNMDAMHAQRAKAFEVVKGQQEAAVQFPHNFGYCPDQQLPRTR